jgi:hypothetical protein
MGDQDLEARADRGSFKEEFDLSDMLEQLTETYGFNSEDIGRAFAEFVLSDPMQGYQQEASKDLRHRQRGAYFTQQARTYFFNEILFPLRQAETTRDIVLETYGIQDEEEGDLASRVRSLHDRPAGGAHLEPVYRRMKKLHSITELTFLRQLGDAVIEGADLFSEEYGDALPAEKYAAKEYQEISDAIERACAKARSETKK